MERQRDACLQFAEKHDWIPIREFWGKVDHEDEAINYNDALMELRAGAIAKKYDILLVSEFDRLGRIPQESYFAAAFFERHGVEVWGVSSGHIGAQLFP